MVKGQVDVHPVELPTAWGEIEKMEASMTTGDHHGDGEELPVTDLEILRLMLPRICGHCSGLLVVDGYGDRLCSECGRSTFTLPPKFWRTCSGAGRLALKSISTAGAAQFRGRAGSRAFPEVLSMPPSGNSHEEARPWPVGNHDLQPKDGPLPGCWLPTDSGRPESAGPADSADRHHHHPDAPGAARSG